MTSLNQLLMLSDFSLKQHFWQLRPTLAARPLKIYGLSELSDFMFSKLPRFSRKLQN
jgi:hypothetical protein